jgi:hypothetical protein
MNGRRYFTISWHACVSPPKEGSLEAAMREAIGYQTRLWKALQPKPWLCATCQTSALLQVDHNGTPLKTIIDTFLEQSANTAPDRSLWGFNARTHAPRLPKGAFVQNWRAYHNAHAQYQLLCRSCNARKGARLN